MGGILSRLRGKPTTKELLEDLEREIEAAEEYKHSTEQQHRRLVGSLIFYFVILFFIGSGVFLFYYYPYLNSTRDKILYALPLCFFPFMCYFLKKFLHWYFTQKIKYNEESLNQLKKKRRSLLDFAMETETYKNVKELLEKYDPEYHRKVFFETRAIAAPPPSAPVPIRSTFNDMEIRKRSSPTKSKPVPLIPPGQTITINTGAGPPPFKPIYVKTNSNPSYPPPYMQRNNTNFARIPKPQMPRPVLPRERTIFDRVIDFVVGDGPSNRYALICRQCQSHNGMALREEFEFIAFRCCYCFHWNPPRNQQQQLPQTSAASEPQRLALQAASPVVTVPDTTSEESSCDESDKPQEASVTPRSSPPKSESGSESPSLRRRLNVSSDGEIQEAVLEEDKPSHPIADVD